MLLDLADQTKALALKAGLSEMAASWVDESTDHAAGSLGIQVR
jgi:hypothetical protein